MNHRCFVDQEKAPPLFIELELLVFQQKVPYVKTRGHIFHSLLHHQQCFHVFLFNIVHMEDGETLYSLAMALWVILPSECFCLIIAISFRVSFEKLHFSPILHATGFLCDQCLLFFTISFAFSCLVPKNKWEGLTHNGLSHLCRTKNNSIGPLNTS